MDMKEHDCIYCMLDCNCGSTVPWACIGHKKCIATYKQVRADYDGERMEDNGVPYDWDNDDDDDGWVIEDGNENF